MCRDIVPQTSAKPLRILMVSENVPPQVNGIARRIGHYVEGLRALGCVVDLISPPSQYAFINPWNSTAEMMFVKPESFMNYLQQDYDVVHVVLPLNVSGLWLLAAWKIKRVLFSHETATKPALVISWHVNLAHYTELYLEEGYIRNLVRSFVAICHHKFLPQVSDCILTPTKTTEPDLTSRWTQTGLCLTGMELGCFHPDNKVTQWGRVWMQRKEEFLQETNCRYLVLCVSRLAREKSIEDLLDAVTHIPDCALWLVGDGNHRRDLELQAQNSIAASRVKFWGYQKGKSLHAVYSVADLFVCSSLTETFGQTVNEALSSEVKVALPKVSVFVEAYGEYVPPDAFWEPHNLESMVKAMTTQLDSDHVPDRTKLKSWDYACLALLKQYNKVQVPHAESCWFLFFLPMWWLSTALIAICVYVASLVNLMRYGNKVSN